MPGLGDFAVPSLSAGRLAALIAKIQGTQNYYIDFVVDCGADPTGTIDCSAACDRAFQLLSELIAAGNAAGNVRRSAVVKFPPGVYRLAKTPASAWNLNAAGTTLILEGCGDASVIAFDGQGANIHWPNIVVENFCARDLAFYGFGAGAAIDCDYTLSIAIDRVGYFENVHWVDILATDEIVDLIGGRWWWRDSYIASCCAQATACLLIRGVDTFEADNCRFYDVGKINQLPIRGKSVLGNADYIQYVPLGTIPTQFLTFRNCIVDELCTNGVRILGTAALPVQRVNFENHLSNPPARIPFGKTIRVEHAHTVDMKGYQVGEDTFGGFDPNSTSPILSLASVGTTTVNDVDVVGGAQANVIEADAACGALTSIDASEAVLQSLAKSTTVQPSGYVAPNAYAVPLTGAS